jgi:hypothetical protein
MKDILVFDTTEIDSSDQVGAHILGSSNLKITSTTVGSREALDVYIAEGINVEVDLSATEDSVQSWTHDGTGTAITSTGGALDVNITNASIAITATDLDIRDLVYTSDSVTAHQGGTWSNQITDGTYTLVINADGSINAAITTTDLDIRDLTHVSDSVSLGDGTALFTSTTIGSDIGLDVNIINSITANDMALTAAVNTALTNQTGAALPTAANRKYLFLYNNGNKRLFVGDTATLTLANGFPISPGSYLELRAGPAVALDYIRETGGTSDLRVLELT